MDINSVNLAVRTVMKKIKAGGPGVLPARLEEEALTATLGTTRDLHSSGAADAFTPQFVRQGKVFDAAAGSYATVYWPWIVKMTGKVTSPLAAYYMYYSTDHAVAGGIAIAKGPTPLGPWTNHGQVFLDTSSGSQTETPSVLYVPWLDSVNKFYMYYQQDSVAGAVGIQSTCLATSPDGLTWTRYGKVLDIAGTPGAGYGSEVAGNGHTGYFTPELVGHTIGGPHLISAGDYGLYARSYSNDGKKFLTDPRLLGYGIDQTQHLAGRMVSWNHSVTFYYKGVLWWAGIVTNFASGEVPKDGRICLARIAEDRRTLLSRPEVIIDGTGPNESVDMRALSIYSEGGKLYLYYQNSQNILVAVAGE